MDIKKKRNEANNVEDIVTVENVAGGCATTCGVFVAEVTTTNVDNRPVVPTLGLPGEVTMVTGLGYRSDDPVGSVRTLCICVILCCKVFLQ